MRILPALLICLVVCSCAANTTVPPVAGATYESIWGHSRLSPAISPPPLAPIPIAVHGGPALWSVTNGNATVYLFGTLHLPMGGTPWLTPTIGAALKNSRQIWTEADIEPGSAFARAFAVRAYDPHYDLFAALPASNWATLATALRQCRIVPSRAKHMHAWAINLQFLVCAAAYGNPMQSAPAATPNAVPDMYIASLARANGIPLHYFETPAQQIAAFSDVPDDVQLARLMQFSESLVHARSLLPEQKRQQVAITAMNRSLLIRYWAQGDTARQTTEIDAGHIQPADAAVHKAMFTTRNNHFANGIIGLLHEPTVSFVAIGVFYLVGADGVIPILQSRGFSVLRLE